jgi:hypothetical protein
MPNYEHKICCISGGFSDQGGRYSDGPLTLALNREGKNGWQLAAVIPAPANGIFAFFRREERSAAKAPEA